MHPKMIEALVPYGLDGAVSLTGIPGPGSWIVVFETRGSYLTACLTWDYQVVWVMTCGGQEVDANSDACNALNAQSRAFFHIGG